MFFPACAVAHKCPLFAYKLLGRRSGYLSRRLVILFNHFIALHCTPLDCLHTLDYTGLQIMVPKRIGLHRRTFLHLTETPLTRKNHADHLKRTA